MMKRNVSGLIAVAAGTAMSISTVSAQVVLYNNGPLITAPPTACVPAGSNASELQVANSLFGSNMNGAAATLYRIADDFTVPAAGWQVTGFDFWGYQTGGGAAASTFTGMTVQIYNGPPNAGGTVIAGDTTTNVMTSTTFDNIYRTFAGGCTITRALYKNRVTLAAPVNLAAGTYWVSYSATGSLASGPWCPNVTIQGAANAPGSNALQLITVGTVWQAITDAGSVTPQDVPFAVIGNGTAVPTGACCLTSGPTNCVVTTATLCSGQGGTYSGDNITCAVANCAPLPTGACCFFNGSCQVLNQPACTSQGGTYSGNNVTCAAAACPNLGWLETGEAGNLPATAQVPTGSGNLAAIRGALTANDVDMYSINICNEAAFGATTVGGATFDTQLFLFTTAGIGLASNDDTATPQAALTSTFVLANGTYLLAISGYDNDAIGASTLQEIWLDTPFNTERAPDGPAAAEAIGGWSGTGGSGAYTIALTGTCYPGGAPCYANCDQSSGTPRLTANDFVCFIGQYANNETTANCDLSTGTPLLTANDFVCFIGAYASGCS